MAGADAAAFEETVRRTRRLQQSHRTASQFDTAGACRKSTAAQLPTYLIEVILFSSVT